MSDALFSPSWYRVADLKPRIRAHAVIHRHAYRGKVWFILRPPVGAKNPHPSSVTLEALLAGVPTIEVGR